MYLFSNDYFEIIYALLKSQTASHTPVADNQEDAFNATNWIIEANKPHAIVNLAVSLSSLELLEEKRYDQFYQLILATKTSDP